MLASSVFTISGKPKKSTTKKVKEPRPLKGAIIVIGETNKLQQPELQQPEQSVPHLEEVQPNLHVDRQKENDIHEPASHSTFTSATPSPHRSTPSMYDDGELLCLCVCEYVFTIAYLLHSVCTKDSCIMFAMCVHSCTWVCVCTCLCVRVCVCVCDSVCLCVHTSMSAGSTYHNLTCLCLSVCGFSHPVFWSGALLHVHACEVTVNQSM